MGWKNVKEHYRIGHIVSVEGDKIHIGSPYIHDIITVSSEGKFLKEYGDSWSRNEDLDRYMSEMKADPAKLKELIQTPDTFTKSIPVYTFTDKGVEEKFCEEAGWPNVTHDGLLMYENTFSTNKMAIVKDAKRSLRSRMEYTIGVIAEEEKSIERWKQHIVNDQKQLDELMAQYPKVEK